MKFAIELANHGPYERVVDGGHLGEENIIPAIGDTIIWSKVLYVVRERIIDYDEGVIVIRAAV